MQGPEGRVPGIRHRGHPRCRMPAHRRGLFL